MAAHVKARLRTRTIVKPECPDVEESSEEQDVKLKCRRFQCHECELEFRTRGFLIRHMKLHSAKIPSCAHRGVRPAGGLCAKCCRLTNDAEQFSCPKCVKSFNQKINLKYHIRVHTGERPFVCAECAAAFKQKSALDNHVRRHTGELPFSCRECGTKFRQRSHLDNHIRLHNGERPYSCDQCDASFPQKSNLNYHMLKHSASTPQASERRRKRTKKTLRCVYEKCKKRSRQSSPLTNHLRGHSGDRKPVFAEGRMKLIVSHKFQTATVKVEDTEEAAD